MMLISSAMPFFLSLETGRSVGELADNLGSNKDLIYQWRKKYDQLGELAFPGNGIQTLTPEQKSMSRKGNCWDNAVAESFFHTLKTQLVFHRRFKDEEEAEQALFNYIEAYYNRRRRHSSNGYQSPATFENEWANWKKVA